MRYHNLPLNMEWYWCNDDIWMQPNLILLFFYLFQYSIPTPTQISKNEIYRRTHSWIDPNFLGEPISTPNTGWIYDISLHQPRSLLRIIEAVRSIISWLFYLWIDPNSMDTAISAQIEEKYMISRSLLRIIEAARSIKNIWHQYWMHPLKSKKCP